MAGLALFTNVGVAFLFGILMAEVQKRRSRADRN